MFSARILIMKFYLIYETLGGEWLIHSIYVVCRMFLFIFLHLLTFQMISFFLSCLSSCSPSTCLCLHFFLIFVRANFLNRFLHWVLCKCSASEGQMLMLYLSIFCMKLKTNPILVSTGHRSVCYFFFFLACPVVHSHLDPYWLWVIFFRELSDFPSKRLFSVNWQQMHSKPKCWQLYPKIYLRTSLTSDLTVCLFKSM